MTKWEIQNRTALSTIKFASLITILTGAICLLGCNPSTQGPWLWLTDLIMWPLDGSPTTFKDESLILNAVLGGVMIGWGLLMFSLVFELESNPKITNKLVGSLLVWFFSDSIASYFANVPGNIVLNIFFVLSFMIPLRSIHKNQATK